MKECKQLSNFYAIIGITILIIFTFSCNNSIKSKMVNNKIALEDGMYLIERSGTKKSEILPLKENEKIISFNKEFIEKTDQNIEYLVINIKEFAPLELAEKPKTENQSDNRKKLLLKLSDEAKNKLKIFTTENLNNRITIVVNNEALTQHKIKSVIDGGLLQITRCTDNACELLYSELQDNIIDKK